MLRLQTAARRNAEALGAQPVRDRFAGWLNEGFCLSGALGVGGAGYNVPEVQLQMLHSLFHSVGNAYCRTDWQKMSGTDRVRRCDKCGVTAFQLEGLSEAEASELIHASWYNVGSLRLSRRCDGTFVCDNSPCGTLAVAPYWHEWRTSLKVLIHVLQRSPIWSFVLLLVSCPFFVGVLGWLSPAIATALSCRIMRAYASELDGKPWTPTQDDFANFWAALGNFYVYWLRVGLSAVLLILPGVESAARGSLGIMCVCFENQGPVDANRESFTLTKGAAQEIIRRVALPIVIWMIWLCAGSGLLWTCKTWSGVSYSYVFLIGFMMFGHFIGAVIGLTYIPILVNLYRRLRARQVMSIKNTESQALARGDVMNAAVARQASNSDEEMVVKAASVDGGASIESLPP